MPMLMQRRPESPEKSGQPLEISSQEQYLELVRANVAVVDFFGPKCPPCKMFGPIFNSAAKNSPWASFGKVNGFEHGEIEQMANSALLKEGISEAGVRFYPTQVLFSNGRAVAMHEGAFKTEEEFAAWLQTHIGGRYVEGGGR